MESSSENMTPTNDSSNFVTSYQNDKEISDDNDNIVIQNLKGQINDMQQQVVVEKAGKRKLFHSLVKLANELKDLKNTYKPLVQEQRYLSQNWYEGGMWRSPTVLPYVKYNEVQQQQGTGTAQPRTTSQREAISLSDLFFNLVIVTAFTRVGVSITQLGYLDLRSVLYFGIFWTVWSKEASYATRFDTSDLSATASTLVTCFAVLFASLSVQAPIASSDATRIMYMAAFVAGLNCLLHIRVAYTNYKQQLDPLQQQQQQSWEFSTRRSSLRLSALLGSSTSLNNTTPMDTRGRSESISSGVIGSSLTQHVINYAVFNIVMTTLEFTTWLVGIFVFPIDWEYRWCIFLVGLLLAQRIPRAFLANDFHAASSRRGVLYILLLGFLLQSVVVVASEFFEYQTPTLEDYSFIGAACLMFFCIKLLYVDDSNTFVTDHPLLVNRWAGFFFNIGQFTLLLSTTVMGSGLNLLTHEYLAATAALPGPAKTLVCGGYSAVLFSTFFIKSLHVKRVPTDGFNQALFVGAYVIQAMVLLAVVAATASMTIGRTIPFLESMMQYDSVLLFVLSGAAFVVVILCWLDEGVELILYESAADSHKYRVHPFGIWWCLAPDVTEAELEDNSTVLSSDIRSTSRLSVLSPLLGSSIANLKEDFIKNQSGSNLNYQSV